LVEFIYFWISYENPYSPLSFSPLQAHMLTSSVSKLPEIRATGYRAMYTNGMHLRIRSAKEEKVTCDSTVASTIWK
jgi:hypothetical protein